MHQCYKDAISIIQVHGKPKLFNTFTYNLSWPKLVDELLKGKITLDHLDLVIRAFKQ